jgi:putative hydrolases of HD superfamily
MKTKTPKPISSFPKNTHPIITAYFEFTHLKQLYRQGWLHKGIPTERCESVAEHSFGVAVIGMFLVETYFPDLDLLKVLRMSLIHDFGEVYAGDFTPEDGISLEQKHQLEKESISQIFSQIPSGDDYLRLWEEFEKGLSPESRFVRQIDKLEMALQARAYKQQGFKDLWDFYQSASAAISDPRLNVILEELQQLV